MKETILEIIENRNIAKATYLMKLKGDTSSVSNPGEFIDIKLDGLYLRRPMSICDYDDDSLTIIYKTVGKGTNYMSKLNTGIKLNVLTGLGNGFDMDDIKDDSYLIAGGVGIAPIYCLAKRLKINNLKMIMGFNNKDEIFLLDEFINLGIDTYVTTMDGSHGIKGTVVDAIKELNNNNKLNYVCACGPEPMIKAVYDCSIDGQLDLSARMGCGFGACMGCTIDTKNGAKRVCKEGPIFKMEEIIW